VKTRLYERRRGKGLLGFRIGKQGGAGGGEEALEEEGGGDLIDDVFAVEAGGAAGGAARGMGGVARQIQEGVGVVGGEAFVEEVVDEGGVGLFERLSEGLGLGGLGAGRAVGVERIADEEDFDLVLADEASNGFEIGAEGGAVQGEEGLGGEAEGVGDGETDAAVADVECEGAGMGHGVSVRGRQVVGRMWYLARVNRMRRKRCRACVC
jgi:hypothetical protein